MTNFIRNVFLGCFQDEANRRNMYHTVEYSSNTGHAVGVIRVVIQSANIKKRLFRTPRPFIRIGLQGDTKMYHRTRLLKEKTLSPNWISESIDLIVYSLQDILEFRIMNEHRIFKPSLVGIATFSLGILDIERSLVGVESFIRDTDPAIIDPRGTLLFDVFYYPMLLAARTKSNTGQAEITLPDSGIVTLRIQSITNFIWEDHLPRPNKLVANISLGWTKMPIHTTHASASVDQTPVWNSAFDFICFQKSQTIVVIKITDDASSCSNGTPLTYGHISVALDELLMAQDEKPREMWPLSGCPHGVLNISAEWKSIDQMK